jgi:radical SAM-linked protein
MAAALPVGFTSRCEITDIWLDVPLPNSQLKDDLQRAAPPGLLIDHVEEVSLNLPALQTLVRTAEYEAAFPFEGIMEAGKDALPVPVTHQMVADFLSAGSLVRERRGKMYDLRPLVDSLELHENGILYMRLAAREGATARPEEVLSALGLDSSQARVERTRLILAE